MIENEVTKLVILLRSSTLRNRIGILLLPSLWLGQESDLAARLGIDCDDHRALMLHRLSPGQQYLGISWADLVSRDLDAMARRRRDGGCLLIANVDLVLSSFQAVDRSRFWEFLRGGFRPACGLILALPEACQRLISDEERQRWMAAGRLARWS